jgi:hypothetical protein
VELDEGHCAVAGFSLAALGLSTVLARSTPTNVGRSLSLDATRRPHRRQRRRARDGGNAPMHGTQEARIVSSTPSTRPDNDTSPEAAGSRSERVAREIQLAVRTLDEAGQAMAGAVAAVSEHAAAASRDADAIRSGAVGVAGAASPGVCALLKTISRGLSETPILTSTSRPFPFGCDVLKASGRSEAASGQPHPFGKEGVKLR